MALEIFNVLHREKEPFVPLHEGKVNMYVCGPTVYDHAHIGHAKTYVSFDVVVRYLRFSGYDVLYVQNLTDVGHLLDTGEDRILKKARQAQAGPMQIVETYARSYFEDMDALGVQRPDISPRASGHIPEQIKMIETLIEKGHAYVSDGGNVYFDVTSWPEFGKLSNRQLDEQQAGVREDVREDKRHPADFALWKIAEPEHILRWDSPWGTGYPGWHIECSAMAHKYLGETFDIHGGGIDNIFPHNECEIAQSEAAHDAEFARYWMLVGTLMVADEFGIPTKMSKSLGNFYTIKDALKLHRPEVIRMFILGAHYRSPIVFSEEALEGARRGWERIYGAVRLTREKLRNAPEGDAGSEFRATLDQARAQFISAMDDDFNAPGALAALHDLTREVNILLNGEQPAGRTILEAIDQTYRDLGGQVLGIVPDETAAAGSGSAEREEGLIRLLIELRAQARADKNFKLSDLIRDRLGELGVTVEDRADGTVWRVS
ncbi:MAG TPA: cysteine--tRNA ligase [Aggregatilineaceae bacterium]|nr:cysteine--tRNA ligase [Anaerolineae bacterium]HMM27550.1 cysteine--tRNA ligase [Aggregatilineaceae bacterium]